MTSSSTLGAPVAPADPRDRVVVGTAVLDPADVVRVARHGAGVRLADDALEAIARGRVVVDELADDDQPHYGISTGFGALATSSIPPARRVQLQRSLVRSHAA
ncbi:MAG: aromatic amino acid lyase, partial [Kineosporiaceae bacterium]